MGMTPRELLRQVELPLALPSIVAGIRVAAVVGVGSATIAAAIGAGGLGEYIYRGLSMVDSTVILAGAIPAALLALAVDGGTAVARAPAVVAPAQSIALRRPWARPPQSSSIARAVERSAGRAAQAARSSSARRTSPSRLILGELVAQTIERETRPARRAPAEPGRHADLRSRAAERRCRRLRRVHGHGADRDLPSAASRTIRRPVFDTVRDLYAQQRPHAAARRSASTTRLRSSSAATMRATSASGRSTMPRACRHDGAQASGTSFWNGRMDIRAWRQHTACGFPDPPHVMDLTLSYRALAVGAGGSDRGRCDGRPDQRPRSRSARGQPALLPAIRRCACGASRGAASLSAGSPSP